MQMMNITLSADLDARRLVTGLKGYTKTGVDTRFSVSVIVNGLATSYSSVAQFWAQTGFEDSHYGFGRRLQMQVATYGLAAFIYADQVFIVAKEGK